MVQKFTREEVKGVVGGAVHPGKTKAALKAAGLLYKPSVKKWELKKALTTLAGKGLLKKTPEYTPRAMIRRVKREIAAEAKAGVEEKPKEKMTPAEWREKMQEEKKHKEEVERRLAAVRGERVREEAGVGKRQATTSAVLRTTARTSALEPQKGPGRPETTTSALRKPAAQKPAEEEKPKPTAIDLPID